MCADTRWSTAVRILSTARLLLALGLAALAGTRPGLCVDISIPASTGGPGACVPVTILLANNGQLISGLQFDVSFDASALSLSSFLGASARSSGKSLYVAALAPNRIRVLIWELNRNPILGGVIVSLFANVAAGAALGVYPIHFESALATGPHGQPVYISSSDGALTLKPLYGAPVVSQGVLNGASLLPGPVAPGEVITIIGSAIGSVSVPNLITFSGLPAPVMHLAPDQIDAVVPFGVAGRTTTTLEIANPSRASTGLALPVVPSAPGIFTLNGSGAGPGAILNQDLTINSPDNPAETESIITIYATGAGQTYPAGIDGLIPTTVFPKPRLPVSVQVGGVPTEILYAGAAPDLISGVLQLNCRLPGRIAAGSSLPVLLTVGGVTSPPVTVAVKRLRSLRISPIRELK